jgi:CO dehydrogenase/acetyl-CoA synthase gamma subunit (corrinoid Fe-S protein)
MGKFIAICFLYLASLACIRSLSSAAVECPKVASDISMNLASQLAKKGFNLTEEDGKKIVEETQLTEDQINAFAAFTKEQGDACDGEMKKDYIAELVKLGKAQTEINDWMKKDWVKKLLE